MKDKECALKALLSGTEGGEGGTVESKAVVAAMAGPQIRGHKPCPMCWQPMLHNWSTGLQMEWRYSVWDLPL